MTDLEEALRQVPLFTKLPQETLQWLSEHGEEIWLQPGVQIAKQGDPPDGFYIILEGKTEWTRTVGEQAVHAVTLEAGDVFAELILLLDEPYPSSGYAITDVHLYKLTPEMFWEMLCTCPSIPRRILKISAQRSQIHEAVSQQQAKLISLGTLSAGLAHELNNPAAAARRGVEHLEEVLQKLPTLALKLHQQPITEEHREFLYLPRISAYGRQLNQVWTNLIDNAIDATGGKGHIWIRTSQEGNSASSDRSASRIVVEIADDGVGIPPEIQPRIFEQFFTTKEVGKGTGLGLDIARRIVVGQHKGDIRVDSKPGDTRFQVRLPINNSESATK